MENVYYIYVFLDQRYPGVWKYKKLEFKFKPFYIGKGKNKRIEQHFRASQLKNKYFKNNRINSIINEIGELPIHYRIYENLSEDEAFKFEIDIISHFGKEYNNTGILTNISDGGDGTTYSNKNRWRKVYQYDLDGNFIKEWLNINDVNRFYNNKTVNISRNIKRNFITHGYIWKYDYLGEKIEPFIQYKKPIIYKNIKQIDIKTGEIIKVHDDFASIIENLKLQPKASNKISDYLKGKSKSAFGYKWEL